MRHFLHFFLIVLLSIFGYIFLATYFYGGNVPDYLVAKSYPQYPSMNNWKVYASSGFPDGLPSGTINFQTLDKAEQVIDYYKKKLGDLGWEMVQNKVEKDTFPARGVTAYSLKHRKKIGPYTFRSEITKTELTEEAKERYGDSSDPRGGSKRVIIFIDHREK